MFLVRDDRRRDFSVHLEADLGDQTLELCGMTRIGTVCRRECVEVTVSSLGSASTEQFPTVESRHSLHLLGLDDHVLQIQIYCSQLLGLWTLSIRRNSTCLVI
jgi:hypothetical protein